MEASTGLRAGQVSADWGRTVLGGVKVRVGGAVTTQGTMSTYVTGDRKVTENTKAGLTLDLASNGVMTVKVRSVAFSASWSLDRADLGPTDAGSCD